ncbi:hypothetical protein GCM10009839_92760 [Catenulispora yoronensis]|uniref:PBP domain-containing protein n=2 Tax=Catenulispora yoronensis TaxID=450799 RepID=A0ABN2VML1_9ACTN
MVYGAAVLAWTVSFMTALVLLPPGAHTTAVAHADSSSVTVAGPQKWDPATQTFGDHGTVSVSQTQNLTDQVVHISWTGFTPSTGPVVNIGGIGWQNVIYPVIVYQCRGTQPKITDCYGSTHYGQDPAKGFLQANQDTGLTIPDFPGNQRAAVTHADGSGAMDLEVYTANESPSMACDVGHPCSVVVEPLYGGDSLGYDTSDGSPDCSDHANDAYAGGEATGGVIGGIDNFDFGSGEQCAWNYRTVIPISFAPVPGACTAAATDVLSEGMPMLDRALTQWVVGACLSGSNPVNVIDSTTLTEPSARDDFLAGQPGADVAFTSRPADPAASSAKPYTYVPVGNTGIAIAYYVDDPGTNLPITGMKLNARLVAKLLTQSYDTEHLPSQQVDIASVAGNPQCLFKDPEFLALNPANGFTWPSCQDVDAMSTLPVVAGGKSDLVHQLTAWIAADPDAAAFLGGAADQWGMHVDAYYKTSAYPFPIDSFIPQDASGPPTSFDGTPIDPKGSNRDYGRLKSYEWNPIQSGLDDVVRHLIQNTATCQSPDFVNNTHAKCNAEVIGSRGLLAVMDTGRAAAFSLPTAALPNGTGAYVAPTVPAMTAAAQDYVTDTATGTQSLPWGTAHTAYTGDAAAYPLTLPAYAMAPTSGVAAAKATKIADFLASVTDNRSGQMAGTAPGELAPGYAAITADQAKQAGAAITKIRQGVPGGGPTVTVTATGPVPTGGVTGVPTTSGTVVSTPVTVVSNGKTTVYQITSTINNNNGGNGNGNTGGTTAAPAGSATGSSSSKGAAGVPSSGTTRSLAGSTAPAAAAVGAAAPDTAGPARYLLPTLLVIGVVLVAAGPAGLLLSAPGGLGARLRSVRPRPTRRFGK